jgi:hypothetical protein
MAELTVQCRDEMGDGEWLMEMKLELPGDSPTVRELISRRIEQETSQHNAELDRGRQFRGLVTAPPAVTSELNGWDGRRREGKAVEPEVMRTIAIEAYERGDLVLLIDGEQAGELDSQVTLSQDGVVLFRKLAVLVCKQTDPGRLRTKHEKFEVEQQ